jgi:hypothetical protein
MLLHSSRQNEQQFDHLMQKDHVFILTFLCMICFMWCYFDGAWKQQSGG